MKLCLLLMQRNEGVLLETWGHYHGKLFGYENIHIFDNGSDDAMTLRVLRTLREFGVNINREYSSRADFERKGDIIVSKIKEIELASDEFDFFFPMDCDEFLSASNGESFHFDAQSIYEILSPFAGTSKALQISSWMSANPIRRDRYAKDSRWPKLFFYRGTAKSLDLGFHTGATVSGSASVRTPIYYFHLHNMNYLEKQYRSMQKLRGRVRTFSTHDLLSHYQAKGHGFHLVPDLLRDRGEYYSRFAGEGYTEVSGFRRQLEALGLDMNLEFLMDYDYSAGESQIPSWPFMPPEAVSALKAALADATVYLEYGAGGSTMMASRNPGLIVISVESDKALANKIGAQFSSTEDKERVHVLYTDIGPTREWGHPKSEVAIKQWYRYSLDPWKYMREKSLSPNVVLIDGRFRRSCFLATLVHSSVGTRIFFDDYFDRPHYHKVEKFLKPKRAIGRLAEFERPAEIPLNDVWSDLVEAVMDSR